MKTTLVSIAGIQIIPEPASLELFGIVCGALWFVRRKFRYLSLSNLLVAVLVHLSGRVGRRLRATITDHD